MTHIFIALWLATSAPIPSASDTSDTSDASDASDASDTSGTTYPTYLEIQACLNSAANRPFDESICTPLTQLELDPLAQARVYAALAVGYAAANQWVIADEQLRLALASATDDWHTLANAGVVHLYAGRFENAYRDTSQAMRAHPDFPPYLLLNRALALRGMGQFAAAAKDVSTYQERVGLPTSDTVQHVCDPIDPRCKSAQVVGPRLAE